ncbi:MAG: hypothetical protein JWN23_2829 [Rhodocyclales bacterium]|nr:hypothetical protein [Rhodocyclales bacterium]
MQTKQKCLARRRRRRARTRARRLAAMLKQYENDPSGYFWIRSDAISLARKIGTAAAMRIGRQFFNDEWSA